MEIRIRLTRSSRQSITERLQQAYRSGELRVVKRIHALLGIIDGQPPREVAELLHLHEQTVRAYVSAFLLQGLDSLRYRRSPGRPAKLTPTQRRELAGLLRAGPEAAGYATGCWTTLLIQDLILRHFGSAITRTTCVNYWIAWAFRSRRPVLSPITSMKLAEPSGKQRPGLRSGAWHKRRRP